MDTNKLHTVAIRKDCYYKLSGLCGIKFRRPNHMISKMIDETIRYQAKKNGTSYETLSQSLLENGKQTQNKNQNEEVNNG